MLDFEEETPRPAEAGRGDARGKGLAIAGITLAVIAIALSVIVGLATLRAMRRLEHKMAQLSQQTETARQVAEQARMRSQLLALQASQAAAGAQAAAQERDQAKQEQASSEAQAEAAKQLADQAAQQAEEYRKQREAELAQLQQALGQIADTKRTAIGLVMTLDSKSIRFDFDKADIKPQYRDILNRIAGILMTLKGYSIAVYGYTDDVGTQAYNLKLSERRATAVRDFLVQAGISPKILSTKGFGKADPRVPGNSEKARAANRRVEIGIVDSRLLTNSPLVVPAE
jgi:outer membrane protein OmpA-like peptidoglycan-associated protein